MHKIMVVDDEAVIAMQLKERLTSMGYEVVGSAFSGEEAVEMAGGLKPDIILMDIVMEGKLDGIDASEIIKKELGIPVIFLTAYADDDFIKRAKNVKPFGYILKPFQEDQIKAAIEIGLYKNEMERRLRGLHKLDAVGVLAGGIAHQFNNCLFATSGNIELLKFDLSDNEKINKHVEEIESSVRRMVNLTNQLLAYARGGKYKVKAYSLSDFVKETLPLIRNKFNPAINIETDLPNDILNVEADLTQMQMALLAVLANANDAIEGSGGCIIITVKNEDLDEGFAKDHPGISPGRYVLLTVKDNGKGMDEETKNRVFEPFFTTKPKNPGLGMAAVYGIVKNHAGLTSVESEPGKGTVVRIYLPACNIRRKSS